MGEAFCRMIETLDPHRLPHSGGPSATVVVTIPIETLHGGLAAATMDTGTRLTPGEARRMACDAGLIPVVLGGEERGPRPRPHAAAVLQTPTGRDGDPAELPLRRGRLRRPHGLVRRPPPPTLVPHGRTDLADGVLICGRHHTLVHHPDYTVQRRPGWRISITRTPGAAPRRQ